MENSHISQYKFQNTIRPELHRLHGFDTERLNHVSALIEHGVAHVQKSEGLRSSDLSARHYDQAVKAMWEHPDAKHFSPREREAIESVLKKHLSIEKSEK